MCKTLFPKDLQRMPKGKILKDILIVKLKYLKPRGLTCWKLNKSFRKNSGYNRICLADKPSYCKVFYSYAIRKM